MFAMISYMSLGKAFRVLGKPEEIFKKSFENAEMYNLK